MTTRDVTSASRNLLIIYWVISAFCSYQLGIALRVTTKLVGFASACGLGHAPTQKRRILRRHLVRNNPVFTPGPTDASEKSPQGQEKQHHETNEFPASCHG